MLDQIIGSLSLGFLSPVSFFPLSFLKCNMSLWAFRFQLVLHCTGTQGVQLTKAAHSGLGSSARSSSGVLCCHAYEQLLILSVVHPKVTKVAVPAGTAPNPSAAVLGAATFSALGRGGDSVTQGSAQCAAPGAISRAPSTHPVPIIPSTGVSDLTLLLHHPIAHLNRDVSLLPPSQRAH